MHFFAYNCPIIERSIYTGCIVWLCVLRILVTINIGQTSKLWLKDVLEWSLTTDYNESRQDAMWLFH